MYHEMVWACERGCLGCMRWAVRFVACALRMDDRRRLECAFVCTLVVCVVRPRPLRCQ